MSVADISTSTSTPVAARSASTPSPRGLSAVGGWTRVVLACAVLLGSAGLRTWQAKRIQGEMAEGLRRPRIDLTQLPLELGRWKGETTKQIDEQIARGTGADQIVTRRYVNQDTGVKIDVILLYGPAVEMYIHAPELCYPAAGFSLAGGPDGRTIEYDLANYQDDKIPKLAGKPPEPKQASFRSLVYTKGEGALAAFQEVYYAWRYHDRWTPDAGLQKHFERIPSMYKVHLARPVGPKERREIGNPCESLLKELLPQIEGRIAANSSSPKG